MKLPGDPTPEQVEKLGKLLAKRILEEFYTSGIYDLTVDLNPKKGIIAAGKFVGEDRGKRGKRPEFSYEILTGRGKNAPRVSYSPLSGVSDKTNYSELEEDGLDFESFDYIDYLETDLADNVEEILSNAKP